MTTVTTAATTMSPNRVQCTRCHTILASTSRNDWSTCRCGRVSIEGGDAFLRRVFGRRADYVELSEVEGRTMVLDEVAGRRALGAPRATHSPAEAAGRPCGGDGLPGGKAGEERDR